MAIVARIADPDINGKAISQRVARHISGFVLAWSYVARPLGPHHVAQRDQPGAVRGGYLGLGRTGLIVNVLDLDAKGVEVIAPSRRRFHKLGISPIMPPNMNSKLRTFTA